MPAKQVKPVKSAKTAQPAKTGRPATAAKRVASVATDQAVAADQPVQPGANNVNIPDIFSDVKKQIITLAETTVSNFKDQAVADGNKLVDDIKEDVTRWTKLLASGELKIAEFEFLMGTEKELIQMIALEQAGLAQQRISVFLNGVLNIVIDVAIKKVVGNTNAG